MKKIMLSLFISASVLAITFMACSKENSGTTVKVRLTDNPINTDEVNVDIQQVMVKFNGDPDSLKGWATLDTHAGIYNLLGLQNGVDTLLAIGVIPTNTVKEIRFVLGSDNTIVVNGISYPLTIPSGSESGLKIKVDKKLNGTLDSLLIDFDAALSIHQTGTGEYELKPVLKLK